MSICDISTFYNKDPEDYVVYQSDIEAMKESFRRKLQIIRTYLKNLLEWVNKLEEELERW